MQPLCKYFQQGRCNNPHCKFAHTGNVNPMSQPQPDQNQQVCKYYLQGRCNKENCRFLHTQSSSSIQQIPQVQITRGQNQIGPSNILCREFKKNFGQCPNQQNCQFRHVWNLDDPIRLNFSKDNEVYQLELIEIPAQPQNMKIIILRKKINIELFRVNNCDIQNPDQFFTFEQNIDIGQFYLQKMQNKQLQQPNVDIQKIETDLMYCKYSPDSKLIAIIVSIKNNGTNSYDILINLFTLASESKSYQNLIESAHKPQRLIGFFFTNMVLLSTDFSGNIKVWQHDSQTDDYKISIENTKQIADQATKIGNNAFSKEIYSTLGLTLKDSNMLIIGKNSSVVQIWDLNTLEVQLYQLSKEILGEVYLIFYNEIDKYYFFGVRKNQQYVYFVANPYQMNNIYQIKTELSDAYYINTIKSYQQYLLLGINLDSKKNSLFGMFAIDQALNQQLNLVEFSLDPLTYLECYTIEVLDLLGFDNLDNNFNSNSYLMTIGKYWNYQQQQQQQQQQNQQIKNESIKQCVWNFDPSMLPKLKDQLAQKKQANQQQQQQQQQTSNQGQIQQQYPNNNVSDELFQQQQNQSYNNNNNNQNFHPNNYNKPYQQHHYKQPF